MGSIRSFIFVFIICSLIIVNSGCGSNKSGKASLPGDKKSPVEVRVAFWGSPDEVNIVTDTINTWQKSHPGITVRLDHTPYRGYVDKLLTRIAGRSAPDIVCTEADLFVTFQAKDVLLDLTPFVKASPEFSTKQFYPEIVNRFTVGGKLYAIPRDTAPFACVYYNKKLFDEAGVPYPKDDWNLDDLLDKARKLTKTDKDGRVTQYGFYAWAWPNFVYAFGGSMVDDVKNPSKCTLDSKNSIAGLQFYSDLINKYKVHPSSTAMTNLAMGVQGMFMTGRLAMFSSGIWETPGLRKMTDLDWDVAMFPKGPSGVRAFGTGGSGYCILKETKNPEAAFEVIKALAGRSGQTMLADTGLAQPAIKDIAESSHWAFDDKKPKNKAMLDEAMKYVIYEPFHPAWREAKELYINPELDMVFSGKRSVEDAVKNFTMKVNVLLKNTGENRKGE
ncbi:MAG: sugar ABC transporter substrate-binding protein [Candidatus Omnitrophota bacterium]|nr:sugar ABC transporter substrate-binding protein [Candidatus Omnitrophota bacterium]